MQSGQELTEEVQQLHNGGHGSEHATSPCAAEDPELKAWYTGRVIILLWSNNTPLL